MNFFKLDPKKFWQIILGILLILIVVLIREYPKSSSELLKITVFDVGHGDAIFIHTPENQQILLDGGPDSKILNQLNQEMPFWDHSLDLVILSHPHADHLVGLLEVAERYRIRQILITDFKYSSAEFQAWQDFLKNYSGKIVYARDGQIIQLQKNLEIDVLYPDQSWQKVAVENPNNTSLILKLIFGQFSMLFTGDAECEEQDQVVALQKNLDIDVLKIGHHGSGDAICEAFLRATSPAKAIISAGKEDSEYFSSSNFALLQALIPDQDGQEIYRTDRDGDIQIFSDAQKYWIKTEK